MNTEQTILSHRAESQSIQSILIHLFSQLMASSPSEASNGSNVGFSSSSSPIRHSMWWSRYVLMFFSLHCLLFVFLFKRVYFCASHFSIAHCEQRPGRWHHACPPQCVISDTEEWSLYHLWSICLSTDSPIHAYSIHCFSCQWQGSEMC